jgi:hypothetical protein
MNRTPSLKPRQTVVSVPEHGDGRTAGRPVRLAFGIALWMIGLVILAARASRSWWGRQDKWVSFSCVTNR